MRTLLFIFLFTGIAFHSWAQEDTELYSTKVQFRFAAGYNFALTKLLDGNTTDYLLKYADESYYWQFISVSAFPYKRLGISFDLQGRGSKTLSQRGDKMEQVVRSEYGDKYFITIKDNVISDDYRMDGGTMQYGQMGIVYRFETPRFYVYPKFAIGILAIPTNPYTVFLKEKNSNNVYKLEYMASRKISHMGVYAPSVALGYKLTRHVFLNLDISASYYKFDLEYYKTITDQSTNMATYVERTKYDKKVYNLGVGAGVLVSF
jgi:hypothetical protein